MSAIGDYIHYTAEGYNRYGITKDGEKIAYNFARQKDKINKQLKSSGMTNMAAYQDALNHIFSSVDNSNSVVGQVQSYIETQLNERYQETMGKINWSTGNVSANVSKGKQVATTAIQRIGQEKSILVSSIVARIRAIEQARNNLINSKEKQELTQRINNIYQQLNMIITDGKKIGHITKLKNTSVEQLTGYHRIDTQKGSKGASLVQEINTLLKTYASAPAINLQKGDLFEYAAALAPAIAKNNAQTVIMDELKKGVVGGSRSKTVINFGEFFTDQINLKNLIMKNYSISNHGTTVSYGSSQDKIDINVQWDGQIIPMSAKNVNLKSGFNVHIVTGTSLLYLLQDEPSDFVNHYLNIVAKHGDNIKIDANLGMAHEAMKYTLLYKALTGNTYGRTGASIFLVNDNSQAGGIRIYEMQDLINKASENLNAYTSVVPTLESLSINNPWNNGSYSNRITDFLSNVHAQKMSIALKPSLLK